MISIPEMLLRLGIATILGCLIGLERERVESAAGLRTHAIVALGSALFMLVSMFGFKNAGMPPSVVLDPSRVAAQVVSGIGFLGAGVIIFRKEIIRGLTTAASVWLVAALGMAVGGGLYLPAIGATILGLAILAAMKPLERKLLAKRRPQAVYLVIDRRSISLGQIKKTLLASGIIVDHMEARLGEDPSESRVDVILKHTSSEPMIHLLECLSVVAGIREVRSTIDMSEPSGEKDEEDSSPNSSSVEGDSKLI